MDEYKFLSIEQFDLGVRFLKAKTLAGFNRHFSYVLDLSFQPFDGNDLGALLIILTVLLEKF